MASEDRFGFEWGKYHQLNPNYETYFKRWVHPLTKRDFRGKKILDAGCGMGRNSYWALKWGAERVLAFDYDKRSLNATRKNLKDFSNVKVEFKSIYEIDWQNEFDIVFSIGVIHHLEKPKRAIKNLVRATKRGGVLVVHVYSYEGNKWIIRFIDPFRKHITSKLPIRLVHFVSYFFSIPLWIYIKIFRPSQPFLKLLSKFKFWQTHQVVFDQLIPKIANYWKKEKAKSLLADEDDLEDIQIYNVNNNSWTVIGKKK